MSDRPPHPTPVAPRGLLDTSVVIDIDAIDSALLPAETAISAVTLAELAAGPHAVSDEQERGPASQWDPLPLDADVARAYGFQSPSDAAEPAFEVMFFSAKAWCVACNVSVGRIFATLKESGRTSRRHFADLLIAATALAHALPLYTRNPADPRGLAHVIHLHIV